MSSTYNIMMDVDSPEDLTRAILGTTAPTVDLPTVAARYKRDVEAHMTARLRSLAAAREQAETGRHRHYLAYPWAYLDSIAVVWDDGEVGVTGDTDELLDGDLRAAWGAAHAGIDNGGVAIVAEAAQR